MTPENPSARVRLRCLLIEDRPADAELIISELSRSGFDPEVLHVETEADFLTSLQAAPDIILSDYSLPGLSGGQAFALMRAQGLDIPFILISGTIGEEIAVEMMRLGATDYLLKDRLTRLGPSVRRALSEHRLRKERNQASERLRRSEENYRILFNEAGDGIYISDAEGRLVAANRQGCELFGCRQDTVLGSLITSHIVQPEQARAVDAIRQAPLCSRVGTYHFQRCDGSVFSGEATLKVLADGRLLSIVRDVTERELAHSRIREQAELLNQTHDCIVVTGLAGVITFWNRGAEQLFGWTAPEVLGREFDEQQTHGLLPMFRAAVKDEAGGTGSGRQEVTVKNKTGQTLTIDMRVSPVRNSEGLPTGRLYIATDISEKKKLEEQFLRAQRMENLGLLAAGIAHDMNNILSPVMMISSLLRGRLTGEADQKLLEVLDRSARRGTALVKQISSFAHGRENLPGLVQLKHVARDIAAMVEETFPRNICFTADIPSDLWPAIAISSQIHQVLLNLCVNARDAMPSGGGLRLRLANCELDADALANIPEGRPGRFILLEVADSGCGIPPELQTKIWEPFFTTKEAGKGTGLGLSTVRGIISHHHGFGTMSSLVGQGTTFRFYVPADSASLTRSDNAKDSYSASPHGNGETILIVDDEAAVTSIISTLLHKFGYRTIIASNGLAAHEVFTRNQEKISLVITDSNMPGLDGVSLALLLRQMKPEVRILFCTGTVDRPPATLPNVDVLSKPFEAGTLLAVVRRMLLPA